jgi:hypothetical protein
MWEAVAAVPGPKRRQEVRAAAGLVTRQHDVEVAVQNVVPEDVVDGELGKLSIDQLRWFFVAGLGMKLAGMSASSRAPAPRPA